MTSQEFASLAEALARVLDKCLSNAGTQEGDFQRRVLIEMMWDDKSTIIAALRLAAQQDDAWQPIETAPKNETAVLLGRAGHIPLVGYIGPHRHEWWMPGTGQNVPWEPTHWQPLPAPHTLI